MLDFKLKKMSINKFRNIKSIGAEKKGFELNFKNGINVISGHNGVGKSNILSLISSGTGINHSETPSKNNFQPEFYEFFKISDSEDYKGYDIHSIYQNSEKHSIVKELRFKNDTASKRDIRIIPTTSNKFSEFTSKKEARNHAKMNFGIGYEARVKIPTRYISISRLLPLGESELDHKEIIKSNLIYKKKFDTLYRSYYNEILNDSISSEAKMYISKKKEVKNPSLNIELDNTNRDSKSVGQDSLETIISAIIDFSYFKDFLKEKYLGGILCIDEIDVSLHPVAQVNLISVLEKISEELNLQIFVTTHSMAIIKEISSKIDTDKKRKKEINHSINYIKDRKMPHITSKTDYHSIQADMFMEKKAMLPKTKFYFEDQVGIDLHCKIIETAVKLSEGNYNFVRSKFDFINSKLGKTQLRYLSGVDQEYFNYIGIILDGDSKFSEKNPVNISERILNGRKEISKKNQYTGDKFNILILPDILPPECFIYMIFSHYVSLKNQQESREFWLNLDTSSPNSESREYYEQNNYLIDERNLTTDKIKNHSKLSEITEFIFNENVLDFYYAYDDSRKTELFEYADKFFELTNTLDTKNYSKHE